MDSRRKDKLEQSGFLFLTYTRPPPIYRVSPDMETGHVLTVAGYVSFRGRRIQALIQEISVIAIHTMPPFRVFAATERHR